MVGICVVAPPGAGKTWFAKTHWGRRFCLDTDHAVKLLNDESASDGARPDWVIDKAISLCYTAAKERITKVGRVVVLTNLHHHFDDMTMVVALPINVASYLRSVRSSRADLAVFTDQVLIDWLAGYEDFARRNNIRIERFQTFLSEIETLARIDMFELGS